MNILKLIKEINDSINKEKSFNTILLKQTQITPETEIIIENEFNKLNIEGFWVVTTNKKQFILSNYLLIDRNINPILVEIS